MISFITTPTDAWLEKYLPNCGERFLVACPFIGDYLAKTTKQLPSRVIRTLLTRTDLRDFASGASDIQAVCEVARLGTKVLSLSRLHAKAYVIDGEHALVTSANATHSGMRRNWECGVALTDTDTVEKLAGLLLSGFGSDEEPRSWSQTELENLRQPVEVFREFLPPAKPSLKTGWDEYPDITISSKSLLKLSTSLGGWARLTFDGIIRQPRDRFGLHEIYRTCLPMVAKRFPRNRFPREKLRQQLQYLRGLGVVEFLGDGVYRRTVSSRRSG